MRNNFSKTFKRSIAAIAVSAVLGMGVASADDIVGKVQLNGASVTGVKVKAVNLATGTTRTVTLNEDGSYRLAKLPSGNYKVTVSKDGVVVAESTARASLGTNTVKNFDIAEQGDTEVIQVVGSSVATVDVTSSDAGLVVGEVEIDRMPIARNITAVALLAPGVVQGDSQFGNTPSFGGASVAENVCYINGMEVTNTRQGLGCGQLPFEFYKEFQVKTGGYSAKYGRATGGAINATAKSGTNEWEFATVINYKPNSLRGDGKFSRADGGTGTVFRDTRNDEFNKADISFSVGGPIIKDKLFFYALVNPRNASSQVADGGWRYGVDNELYKRDASGSNNLFWGATVDWDINEDHRLSYFGYSDRSDTTLDIYSNNLDTGVVGSRTGGFLQKRGGETHSLSYTGYWTDDLIITAMAGQIKTEYENTPDNLDCPSVDDARTGIANPVVSCGPGGSFGANNDKNTQYRFDAEYTIGDHTITAGYEYQERASSRINRPITGHSWTYYTLPAGESVQGDNGVLFTNNTGASAEYVRDRIFDGGGSFSSKIKAYYIEDKWQVTDDLTLNIGARIDEFKNWGTTGKLLTEFKTDIAPRLGFSWDPTGNGESKFYGTVGQYYLPVANNTVYRAASGVSDTTTHYTFSGIGADGAPTGIDPVNGTAGNSQTVGSVSTIPEKDIFQAQEADPFSKIEYILGFETMLTDEYTVSFKGTYRYVDTALDDYCGAYSWPYCVLLNPGEDSSWYKDGFYYNGNGDLNIDWDLFDGSPDPGSLTTHRNSDQIMLPKAKNEYYALETIVKYNLDNLRWSFSYSWSHSFGNFEGAVKSDIGQADAGITQDFDFPALMDGANGNQANDRRHVFKFFGSYNLTDEWVVGWNSTLASGRPLSAFGKSYPSDNPDLFGGYGDTFYITNDDGSFTRLPRGSVGETPWTFKVDLSSSYDFEVNGIEMQVSMDIFNVFDIQTVARQNEHWERRAGSYNKFYGSAYEWQSPRSVRLGFEARF
ncbi:MAG: TonB-dependent receptor [Alteromonadaceae bacterium]|nr:TonB-dependent receptor [Alteromonadaceae bacterium]